MTEVCRCNAIDKKQNKPILSKSPRRSHRGSELVAHQAAPKELGADYKVFHCLSDTHIIHRLSFGLRTIKILSAIPLIFFQQRFL